MRTLGIEGSFVSEHNVYRDERGLFREWFKKSDFQSNNLDFDIAQANHSTSGKNVLRGIHYSKSPKGQHKLVSAAYGEVLDVIVDLRVGSPTYLKVEKVRLNSESGDVLFVPSGVGHSFFVVSEVASVVYLTSSEFDADNEKTISPLDPELGLKWPVSAEELVLSERDLSAPTLALAISAGHLPTYRP